MDLVPPRGTAVDHSGDNAKLEVEPRGFFADQFEVGFLTHNLLSLAPCSPLRNTVGFLWTCLRLKIGSMPMTL